MFVFIPRSLPLCLSVAPVVSGVCVQAVSYPYLLLTSVPLTGVFGCVPWLLSPHLGLTTVTS